MEINNDQIIRQLQEKGIQPETTYIHAGYMQSDYKNYPTKPFITLKQAETDNGGEAFNVIQFVQLNDNYQYASVLIKNRKIIDILYDSKVFANYKDGTYYFIIDEQNNLHLLPSVKEALEQDCYIKIQILAGKLRYIQKRPLTSINRVTFSYWQNGNKHTEINERLDLNNNPIYRYETDYNENGERIRMSAYNLLTHAKSLTTIHNINGIYAVTDIFNAKGLKTNHITIKKHANGSLENQYLDENGIVLKVETNRANINIFDPETILDEPIVYQKLPLDLDKANRLVKRELFQRMVTGENTDRWDKDAVNRAIFFGIKPQSTYYHVTPFPKIGEERYRNYPHQKGITLAEAEFLHPKAEFSDLIKVEIGDNYQYKKIIKEKWQQSPILLSLDWFKSLENGSHFFIMNDFGKLKSLNNVEEAVALPSYIRIEKVMGKIVSILKKTRIQRVSSEFNYDGNRLLRQKFKVIESNVIPTIVIKTEYDESGFFYKSQIIENDKGITIRTFAIIDKNSNSFVLERFNNEGMKTNHIVVIDGDEVDNQYLNDKGQIVLTTKEINDEMNPQLYDDLPIDSEEFEEMIFNLF